MNLSHAEYLEDIQFSISLMSQHGLIQLIELPSSPNIILLDIDLINKVIAHVLNQAIQFNGYIQESDILDVIADFFKGSDRKSAVNVISELFKHIDLAIPCNNKGRNSLAMIFWLLTKEILREKGELTPEKDAQLRVELFRAPRGRRPLQTPDI